MTRFKEMVRLCRDIVIYNAARFVKVGSISYLVSYSLSGRCLMSQ